MAHYADRLNASIRAKGTPALVGLDPRWESLPPAVVSSAESRGGNRWELAASAYEEFCRRIIDVVAPLVPAVKPQAAFFEALGPAGCAALRNTIHHARLAGLIVICDAKRGDIGSTAQAYAEAYLAGEVVAAAPWGADALTVNPYLGRDSLEPFARVAIERGAGLYVLVRTSNPGAVDFQDLQVGENAEPQPLYRRVAAMVEELAAASRGTSEFGCVGAVVGATYPKELGELRGLMPHAPFLVPGYGAQGAGGFEIAAALRPDGLGALVNSSRGINFAHFQEPYKSRFKPDDWEQAVEAATRDMIADLAQHTPAAALGPPTKDVSRNVDLPLPSRRTGNDSPDQ